MKLPESNYLPVNMVAACFNRTSATYKYYWFLSILQSIERGATKIQKKELFARMIANAWYTVNYFHVSFGKQDLIQEAIQSVNSNEKIAVDEKYERIFQLLVMSKNSTTENALWHFNNNVPHWFLSPWFPKMNQGEIYRSSKRFENKCLYSLSQDSIEMNPEWVEYLTVICDFENGQFQKHLD